MHPRDLLNKIHHIRPAGSIAGLKELVSTLPDGLKIAEIGCYAGESTELFATKAIELVCVDPWKDEFFPACPPDFKMQDVEDAFDIRMAPWKKLFEIIPNGYFEKRKMKSEEAAIFYPNGYFDLVYIDADHFYASVIKDINTWLPKVKTGGLIGGHDYNDDRWRPEVNRAVDELLVAPDRVFPDCSWLKRVHR